MILLVPAVLIPAFLVVAAIGAVVRFVVGLALNNEFPVGTLVVNLFASFLLGLLIGADVSDDLSMLVGAGALGALSTWSTAANEAAVLARKNEVALAAAYLALMILSGVMFAWFGLRLGQVI